jgi:hypothetical protein
MKKLINTFVFTAISFCAIAQLTSPCQSYDLNWKLGGNNIGNGVSTLIGPCTNQDFILQANGKQSLFIKANSYVGIGQNNNNPQAALDVQDGSGGSTTYHTKLYGDPYGSIESTTEMNLFYNTNKHFSINEGTYAGGSWLPRFKVSAGGNVGIGTTAPTSKLTIDATGLNQTSTNGLNIITQNNSGYVMAVHNLNSNPQGVFAIWNDGRLALGNTGSPDYAKLNINMNGIGQAINVYDISSANTNKVNFRVDNDGRTFIGFQRHVGNHAGAMLHVYGKAVATEVVVTQQNWADFVFAKDYKLMPLNEVENYYKTNSHLPGVPTANDIKENGNDIGKTEVVLLQKIEELTLYIVEQQKQIDELKKITKH